MEDDHLLPDLRHKIRHFQQGICGALPLFRLGYQNKRRVPLRGEGDVADINFVLA